ncbi:RidA family protein [Chloroflexota bacterium]
MPKEVIRTESAPKPLGDYSQAWTVTGAKLIFLAGQVSVDMSGNPVGPGDIALQMRTVIENLKKVLEGAGASLGDVIKLNTYVTNMAEYRERTRDIRREYFSQDFPASTLVEVKSLARPEFMVEIEAIAAVS